MVIDENPKRLGGLYGNHQMGSVYDKEKICPTIDTMNGGNRQPIIVEEVKQIGNIVDTGNWDNPQRGRIYSADGCCTSLNTVGGGGLEPKIIEEPKLLGGLGEMKSNNGTQYFQQDRVYSSDGIAMCHPANIPGGSYKYCMEEIMAIDEQNMNLRKETLGTITTDESSPKHTNRVLIKQATKQGYIECEVGGVFDGTYPKSETRRGRVEDKGNICPTLTSGGSENLYRVEQPNERFFKQALETLQDNECEYGDTINAFNKTVDKSGVSPTLTTRPEGFKTAILPVVSRYRIRKLTPRECGRLMGVSDEDITKMLEVNSNSQCYKQFGNSIVVPVMEAMFRNLNIKGVSNE